MKDDKDRYILERASLDIKLLPETEQDRQMASLMKLQTAKSIIEREKEKQLAVMNKPALPGRTITSFGGLRSEKLLNKKLSTSDLGIKRQITATETQSSNTNSDVLNKKLKSNIQSDTNSKINSLILLNNYSSSESDS